MTYQIIAFKTNLTFVCVHEPCAWQAMSLATHNIQSILLCFSFPFKISLYIYLFLFIHVRVGWVCAQQGALSSVPSSTRHSICAKVRKELSGSQLSPFIMWLQGSNRGHLSWHQVPFPAMLLYPEPILLVIWKMPVYPVSPRGASFLASPSGVLRLQMPTDFFCLFDFNMIFMD